MAQKTLQRTPQAAQPKPEKAATATYGVMPAEVNISFPKPQPPVHDARPKKVVTFTTDDGEVFEIPDLPENLGRATALASERSLSKIWGSEEESKACQDMFGEK